MTARVSRVGLSWAIFGRLEASFDYLSPISWLFEAMTRQVANFARRRSGLARKRAEPIFLPKSAPKALLGASLVHLVAILEHHGAILGHLEAILRPKMVC